MNSLSYCTTKPPLIPPSPSHYLFHWYRSHELVLLPQISKSITRLLPRVGCCNMGRTVCIALDTERSEKEKNASYIRGRSVPSAPASGQLVSTLYTCNIGGCDHRNWVLDCHKIAFFMATTDFLLAMGLVLRAGMLICFQQTQFNWSFAIPILRMSLFITRHLSGLPALPLLRYTRENRVHVYSMVQREKRKRKTRDTNCMSSIVYRRGLQPSVSLRCALISWLAVHTYSLEI